MVIVDVVLDCFQCGWLLSGIHPQAFYKILKAWNVSPLTPH